MAAVDFSNIYSATYSSVSFVLFIFAAGDRRFCSFVLCKRIWANGID